MVTGRKPNVNLAVSVDLNLFWEEMLGAINKCNAASPVNSESAK